MSGGNAFKWANTEGAKLLDQGQSLFNAERVRRNAYCLNSTSVAPVPPWSGGAGRNRET
jgi:hypothetical protein